MKLMITGASSQVGAALVTQLLQNDHDLYCVSRSRPLWIPVHPRLTWITDDLEGWSGEGCDGVEGIVSAAPLHFLPALIDRLAELRRVVAFSSTSAESKAASTDEAERAIARDLQAGETALADACEARGVDWVILRPTIIYGAGLDRSLSRWARWLRRWPLVPLPARGTGRRQPVHVADLAAAAARALEVPEAAGRRYDLPGGEVIEYRVMLQRVGASVGRSAPVVCLPALARLVPLARRLPGLGDLNAAMLARVDQDLVFDDSDAARDLSYAPRGFRPVAADWQPPEPR